MKITATWKENLKLVARSNGHEIAMDSTPPFGQNTAPSPKQLLLAAVCGCTGMDVLSLLKKYRQPFTAFEVEADATVRDGHPTVFSDVRLTYRVDGELDAQKVQEAVNLSQTKYCSISAMVSRAAPIHYTIELNGKSIGEGKAEFQW